MIYRVFNLGSINLKVSPLLQKDGDLLRCTNLDSTPFGAKRKRSGYITYLGTANGSAVTDVFSWRKEDGTSLYTYRNSGGILYYSTQGTGAWTTCGNGTVTASAHVGHAVLENTMFISQAGGTTRHTTSGTSFTDTTAAPAGAYVCASRDNRIYVGGTGSTLFYSTTGDGTNWSTSGTADSSSIKIPGEGGITGVWYANDKVTVSKDSGLLYAYDGYSLFRLPTNQAPSSFNTLAQVEDYWIYLNRQGYFGFGGAKPELLSNAIENQIYNDDGTGITGSIFGTAVGAAHKLKYYCSAGTVTDEITGETVSKAIHRYDFQLNQWDNYSYYNYPVAWHSFRDADGVDQLVFASSNQCYKVSGTAVSDNSQPIEVVAEGVLHLNAPEHDKYWRKIWAMASPGCQAKLAVAFGDSFSKAAKKWMDVGSLTTGCADMTFPPNSRGKLMFWRLYEYSKDARFTFYGFALDAEVIGA